MGSVPLFRQEYKADQSKQALQAFLSENERGVIL